jgi:hypothetical protein
MRGRGGGFTPPVLGGLAEPEWSIFGLEMPEECMDVGVTT